MMRGRRQCVQDHDADIMLLTMLITLEFYKIIVVIMRRYYALTHVKAKQ